MLICVIQLQHQAQASSIRSDWQFCRVNLYPAILYQHLWLLPSRSRAQFDQSDRVSSELSILHSPFRGSHAVFHSLPGGTRRRVESPTINVDVVAI